MKETLKLAITGPHSSGKTTLLNALRNTPEFENIEFLPEVTRTIKNQGFDINEAGTLDTQVLIMATHMQNLLTKKRFIVDRCLIDGYCYTSYLKNNQADEMYNTGIVGSTIFDWFDDYCRCLTWEYLKAYDKIFYIPAEIPLVDDGTRSTNSDFHNQIIQLFESRISTNYLKAFPGLIQIIRGTVEERTASVLDIVRKLDKE